MSHEDVSVVPEDSARAYYGPDGLPQFFSDPAMDRFVAVIVKLTQELWVTHEKLDSLERAVIAKGLVSPSELETFASDGVVSSERDAALMAYVHRVLGSLREPS